MDYVTYLIYQLRNHITIPFCHCLEVKLNIKVTEFRGMLTVTSNSALQNFSSYALGKFVE